jgi:methionyl-tRNA formyltransferase
VSVVVLAYHEMGCMGLRTLLRRGVEVSAVFTYDDDPDENCWFGSVAEIAREAGIETHLPARINDDEWVACIRELAPDVIFSFYYRDMVGKRIRSIPRYGALNLHGSLLPRYRGRSPLNWQLVHGETRSGVTLHHMVRRADAGDIVDQEAVEVGIDDAAIDLYRKLLVAGERVLERRLDEILSGTAPRRPQDESQATLFGGRTPEDGRIDWEGSARSIHNLVRAVAPPWPGAFSDGPGGRTLVWRTRLRDDAAPRWAPGTLWVDPEGRTTAVTGEGLLELVEFQPPQGITLKSGDRLGASGAQSS